MAVFSAGAAETAGLGANGAGSDGLEADLDATMGGFAGFVLAVRLEVALGGFAIVAALARGVTRRGWRGGSEVRVFGSGGLTGAFSGVFGFFSAPAGTFSGAAGAETTLAGVFSGAAGTFSALVGSTGASFFGSAGSAVLFIKGLGVPLMNLAPNSGAEPQPLYRAGRA